MKKWEYLREVISVKGDNQPDDQPKINSTADLLRSDFLIKKLSDLGDEGWKLIYREVLTDDVISLFIRKKLKKKKKKS